MQTNHLVGIAFVLGSVAALAGGAHAAELPPWFTERRIIGNNDLEPIEKTLDTDAYTKARVVSRVEMADGTGFCTGSRVGEDLFLTNYHCFEVTSCENLRFHIGYEKDLPFGSQLVWKCAEVLAKNELYDYALYRVQYVSSSARFVTTKTLPFYSSKPIPDNDPAGVAATFNVAMKGFVKDAKVQVKLKHTHVGDLRLELVSPKGTSVMLQDQLDGNAIDLDKTFTVANGLDAVLDEDVTGTWTLKISDLRADDLGKLDQVKFTFSTTPVVTVSEELEPGAYPPATLYAGKLEVGQKLLVAGHPSARLKEIDRSDTCVLRTAEAEDMYERKTLTHTCDTEGGSSGSPVLDRETGNVVALHWGGTNEYNMAIPMALVVGDLEATLKPEDFARLNVQR